MNATGSVDAEAHRPADHLLTILHKTLENLDLV